MTVLQATRWEAETKSLHGRLTSHEEENIGLQARIKELEDERGVSLVPEADNQQVRSGPLRLWRR